MEHEDAGPYNFLKIFSQLDGNYYFDERSSMKFQEPDELLTTDQHSREEDYEEAKCIDKSLGVSFPSHDGDYTSAEKDMDNLTNTSDDINSYSMSAGDATLSFTASKDINCDDEINDQWFKSIESLTKTGSSLDTQIIRDNYLKFEKGITGKLSDSELNDTKSNTTFDVESCTSKSIQNEFVLAKDTLPSSRKISARRKSESDVPFRERELKKKVEIDSSSGSTEYLNILTISKATSEKSTFCENISSSNSVTSCYEIDDTYPSSSQHSLVLSDVISHGHNADEIAELKRRCARLEQANESLRAQLIRERNKFEKLEQKLDYIKENQDMFLSLKKTYMKLKNNENTRRKAIDTQESGVQTESRNEDDEDRRYVQIITGDSIIVQRKDYEKIMSTMEVLKEAMARRETYWSLNNDVVSKNKTVINILENENSCLRNLLSDKEYQYTITKKKEEEQGELLNKELGFLREIIIKLDKSSGDRSFKTKSPLNDHEKEIIQHLMTKYLAREKKFIKPTMPDKPRIKRYNKSNTSDKAFTSRSNPTLDKTKNENKRILRILDNVFSARVHSK